MRKAPPSASTQLSRNAKQLLPASAVSAISIIFARKITLASSKVPQQGGKRAGTISGSLYALLVIDILRTYAWDQPILIHHLGNCFEIKETFEARGANGRRR
jgi:hypothetical protein